MSALLLSLPHVTRLARVLVQSLEIDCSDQKILEETGMGTSRSTSEIFYIFSFLFVVVFKF